MEKMSKDYYIARGVLPIQQRFHKSKLQQFEIVKVEELRENTKRALER